MAKKENGEIEIIFTPENPEDYLLPVCLDEANCSSEEYPCAWCLQVPANVPVDEIAKYIKELKRTKNLRN